jgi:hypothetical protein
MQTRSLKKTILVVLTSCFTLLVGITTVIANGNDFVVGEFRVDLAEVTSAQDYKLDLLATSLPSQNGGYTAGWIGIYLDNQTSGHFPKKFTQVGLYTDKDRIYWFVYSEAGVACLQGNNFWNDPQVGVIGCRAYLTPSVTLNTWHTVELVSYGTGFWYARVYDANQNPKDVAQIFSSSTTIYRAYSATEEAYSVANDPNLEATFYHHEPRYKNINAYGDFQLWPRSNNGNISYIGTTTINTPLPICPNKYGATPNIDNYHYKWFAGTGGQICSWILFPPLLYHYLPLIMK